jgi:hypothetical protein
MQQRSVVVIVVLVTVGLLFLMGLGAGLFRGAGEPSREEASAHGEGGWTAALGGLLSPLGPDLDREGLRCAGQALTKPFRLDGDRPACDVEIPRKADGPLPRTASLRLVTGQASVYVLAELKSGDRTCIPEGRALGAGLRLKVRFQPRDGEEPRPPCWLPIKAGKPVNLVVFEDGGTLSLACEGCGGERGQQLELTLDR